jgi:hypothetical protein
MKVGSWFEYKVTEERSDVPGKKTHTEHYAVASINGDDIVFDKCIDGKKTEEQVEGRTSFGNGLVRNDDLKKYATETIDTAFGKKTVDVSDSMHNGVGRCGGSTVTYVGSDGVMYRSIEKQLWSMGVRYTLTRDLVDLG